MEIVYSILQIVGVIALVVLVFNLIIIVHELGHFLAGRWRGLEIEKFQIWFGKPIWSKTIDGVQYGLGSIPAGGFVALPQMAPMELLEGKSNREGKPLKPIKPLDKMIVAFAGPLFSFMLAFAFACVVWIVGVPIGSSEKTTQIGWIQKDSPAAQAGLQPGDIIKTIDGKEARNWAGMIDSVTWLIVAGVNETVEVVVERDGKLLPPITVKPEAIDESQVKKSWLAKLVKRPPIRKIGIAAPMAAEIFEVKPNSPAEEAGLKPGDTVLALNGQQLLNFMTIEQWSRENPGKAGALTVQRGAEQLELNFTPRSPEKPGDEDDPSFFGVAAYGSLDPADTQLYHPAPVTQVLDTFRIMYGTIAAVTSPNSGISVRHLNGPLGIMHIYYQLFLSPDGFRRVLWFSVILNVNLGLLNLLPLPILDGGHILMALIEKGFRRTINLRVLEVINGACALLLIGFMLFISVFDGGDIVDANKPAGEFAPAEFLPPDQRGAQ